MGQIAAVSHDHDHATVKACQKYLMALLRQNAPHWETRSTPRLIPYNNLIKQWNSYWLDFQYRLPSTFGSLKCDDGRVYIWLVIKDKIKKCVCKRLVRWQRIETTMKTYPWRIAIHLPFVSLPSNDHDLVFYQWSVIPPYNVRNLKPTSSSSTFVHNQSSIVKP